MIPEVLLSDISGGYWPVLANRIPRVPSQMVYGPWMFLPCKACETTPLRLSDPTPPRATALATALVPTTSVTRTEGTRTPRTGGEKRTGS